jgi:YfiH family protein
LTRDPAVTLAMTFADCVPVWLYAPDLPAVGLVHAGWRGTALGVVQAACAGLAAAGAAPERLYAAIGPAIGGCCYQVGEEVAARLRSLPDADGGIRSEGDGHYRVDLPWLNRAQLRAVGVPERHLASVALCTACHPGWFFSHRGGAGRTGRMGGFLCLTTP